MPNEHEGRSEFFGGRSDRVGDFSRREPAAIGEFVRVELEWPLVFAAVHPDELLRRCFAGVDLEQPLRYGGQLEADFFSRFAQSTGVIRLTGIDMTGDGRVPHAGEAVFFHRALLQKQLALGVEDEQVNGAVPQAKPVHLAARLLTDDMVVRIDDIKYLFTHKSRHGSGVG